MAKTASASAPSMPTRRTSCGVRRYGSVTRGSGGRNRPDGERRSPKLAKDAHLPGARNDVERRQHGAAQREDRRREDQVEAHAGDGGVEQRPPRRDLLADEEVEHEAEHEHERRHDDDRDDGRVGAVAPGGLSITAGPVAGQREQQRGQPQRVEREHIEQEPPAEAGHRAGDRPAQERDADQDEQQHVGRAAEQVERREERRLEEGRDEHEAGDRGGVAHRSTSTTTESSEEKSTCDSIWTCWYRSVFSVPTEVTRPIGI